ncbi:IS256 family transposase [Candidatus Palauibacter sp.]|uniref:IS256 family transposase n=1 Tax=Candidatus Palauibacter sp. TaxID=3101350 RepID=UPI003B5B7D21
MGNDTRERFAGPAWETLEAWVREQARDMIQQALEEEVTELLGRMKSERRASVDAPPGYRNGYGKPRRLAMSSGTIEVRRPRVRGLEERFESRVLPLFQRRTREVGELIPELYLHGLAEGDFELALRGLLGDGAPLSKSSVGRLRAKWTVEHEAWSRRPLEGRELVYAWADGIYVKAGLEKDKAALLVVIGAMSDGTKEVLAVTPGYRESTASWAAVLRDLKARGLATPKLLVADGNLGIRGAAREVWPETAEQRCWNHKTMGVLDRLPKREQAVAREMLRAAAYAPSRAAAKEARKAFAGRYGDAHPKAVEVLDDDWDRMTAFHDFPEQHWRHLRTTNVVESPFASVRLRTTAAKRFKRVDNATALIWRLLVVAEKRFRKLNAPELLRDVYEGRRFEDGKPVPEGRERIAA